MKRLIALLTVLLCVALPAMAEQRVFDEADLLSAATESQLETAIGQIGSQYSFDVVIATVPHTNNQEPRYFAADFYDYGGFGYNSTHDGVLLLIVSSTRKYFILTTGTGERIFSDSVLYDIEDAVVPSMRRNDFNNAAIVFVDEVGDRLQLHTPLGRANALFPFLVAIGLVVALITTLIFKAQMKTVRRQTSATQYIRQGSFNLSRVQDVYLYSSTTRTRIETSSSSGGHSGGGGGFTGSSGTHHGGHGGSF
ncbi:MAG: TPM domain-containing protein [Clostridia bacterium]|nr:TPM domain-containing protein [Clostridia bacterium]